MKTNPFFSKCKSILALFMVSLILLVQGPATAQAQWPPFSFRLIPSYESDLITYRIRFVKNSDIEWDIRNVRINIPLPAGTHFVETEAPTSIETSFDGAEVRFFAPMLPKQRLTGIGFRVKVTEPQRATFTTHAWLSWEGDQAGDFLSKEYVVDISRQPLNWTKPPARRLEINTAVTMNRNTVTYFIYPRTMKGRIWDIAINMPIPAGATLQSITAPPPFAASSTPQSVTLTAIELERQHIMEPIQIQLSTTNYWRSSLQTNVVVTWKNAGRRVGHTIPFEETFIGPPMVMPTRAGHRLVTDKQGDGAFANYDLTGVTLQDVYLSQPQTTALKATFQVGRPLGNEDQPLQFTLFIDRDCDASTGNAVRAIGTETRIVYDHKRNRADFATWDAVDQRWRKTTQLLFDAPSDGQSVTVWVPYKLLSFTRDFCWLGKARYRTTDYEKSPSADYIPDSPYLSLLRYEGPAKITFVESELPGLPSKASTD